MSQPETRSPLPAPEHSKAFERLVEEPDDIVGLLAYALYKRTLNERKAAGHGVMLAKDRAPQAHEISLYRDQAENYLRAFAQTAIEGEKASLWVETVKTFSDHVDFGIEAARRRIESTVRRGTSVWLGVTVGIVAWLISLAISILIYAMIPEWLRNVASHVPPPPG